MVDNQLARYVKYTSEHVSETTRICRYSKVLEANLGNVYSVGALPSCLVLKTLTPYPTNTTQPESLAQVCVPIFEGGLNQEFE